MMNCPRCCLPAEPIGTADVAISGEILSAPCFQCPRCVVPSDLFGRVVDVVYTFAATPDGRLLDARGDADIGPRLG